MKDFISAEVSVGAISEWCIIPRFCVNGEVMDIPETFYSSEDSSYQQDTWIEALDNTSGWVSVFFPLLASFYCNSDMTHFTGAGDGFEGELEEFWDNTMVMISDIRNEYESMDREEFIEYYGEESIEALKFLGDTEVGVVYDTEVKNCRLCIYMYFGDCSVGGDSRVSDSPGFFAREDMPEVEYTSHLEQLDRGEVPDELTHTDMLSDKVLVYSLGRYIFNQYITGDDIYTEESKTETLYNLLTTTEVDTEDLGWCELEGKEVTDKWVQLVDSLS